MAGLTLAAGLGGTRIDLVTKEPRDLLLPAWTDTPGPRHGWLARLRIRRTPLSL